MHGKSGLFSLEKLGLALGLGSGLAFQVVKMSTFDEADGVQGWESDEKSVFHVDKVWAPTYGKNGRLFSKAWVALGLGLGLAFTFNEADGVQGCESDEKSVFGQSLGPKVF